MNTTRSRALRRALAALTTAGALAASVLVPAVPASAAAHPDTAWHQPARLSVTGQHPVRRVAGNVVIRHTAVRHTAVRHTAVRHTVVRHAVVRHPAPVRITGGDLSWPQCPKGMGIPERRSLGLPLPAGTFAIIGLTNGPGFTPNPCLAMHADWARSHHKRTAAYALTTYPTDAQLATYGAAGPFGGDQLRNAGYAQAQFNVDSMQAAGLTSPIVWVDVEPYRVRPWSGDQAANRAVVEGALAGYRARGYAVGIYSTAALWRAVVGGARYGLPEWRAAGNSGLAGAVNRCVNGPGIQGGPAIMGQWAPGAYDFDVVCPAHSTSWTLSRYFHAY
jgi:hypothetical protein